ncbi:MAG: hypothetical protein CMB76_03890 [Euryarchaeota archaeon]|nr:hypothetical protein [Euryarchaeota archaeon]
MAKSLEKLDIKNGWNGFALTLTIYIPLSIISFLNESVNGCFMRDCEYPSYYLLPRVLAVLSALILLIVAGESRGKPETHERGYAWGILSGTIIGFAMFVFFSAIGWLRE